MTITQLEYIIAVDFHRSFADAAESCFVTQPTLSMQIKKLEEDLGILIFDRSKKPVITTEIGKKVIEQARQGVREVRRIREIIKDQENTIEGDLRIGIIPTLSPYLLPLFITEFIQKYPGINLIFEELLSEQIAHKLSHNLLDVGILVSPINAKDIVVHPLFYESFVVYMSTTHPLSSKAKVSFNDLHLDEMWLLKEGHCFRNQSMNICEDKNETSHRNHLHFESGSLETLMRIVEKQFGYTLLPELATRDMDAARVNLVKYFRNPQPVREVSLVTHRSFLKKRMIGALKESILSHIPEHMLKQEEGELIRWD